MLLRYPLYINGEFIQTKRTFKVINPSRGEALAEVSVAEEKEIELALTSAQKAFKEGAWRDLSLSQRKGYLLKIAQGIREEAQAFARIESLNSGKPIKETTFMDVPSAAETFSYFAENLEGFLKPEIRKINTQIAQAEALLSFEPRGVVVLIVPFNYPLLIASWKLSQALAAGNTVILKPSSLTPLTVLELTRLIQKAGLPAGVVNVVCGDADRIGELLCQDRRVDMISFTGSNTVGKRILGYTAKDVKKSIMELGGKSTSIVFPDADLELAINGSLCGIFLNQGQMCTALSRLLVHKDIYERFLEEFVEKAKRIKLGDSLDFQTQMGPLISEAQRQKVISFVEEAEKQKAKILCGGKIPQEENLKRGFFFPPTVITDVEPPMQIFQEEVFGPVVCVSKFSSDKEAIALANHSIYALAGSLWTKDIERAKSLARQISAGVIWINTYGMFFQQLPYGGFKQSGFGKELGREGFLEYSLLKNIIVDTSQETKPLVNYWYGF